MLTGAHMSIAGGVDRAVPRGVAVGCRSMQIFTKNASQWAAPPIPEEVARRFREEIGRAGIAPVVSHDSYLINLGTADPALRRRSIDAFRDELDRAEQLGLLGVVAHPGAHLGAGEAAGLERIGEALREVLKATKKQTVMILIENTAGQGTVLGAAFRHLGRIIELTGGHPRMGVCLDSCHLHAAGYDLTTDGGYAATFREFESEVGFDRLRCFHLNDSLKPPGSRVDRHTHIGEGTMGLEPFRRLMLDPRFENLPGILETPKNGDGVEDDRRNLATLAGLGRRGSPRVPRRAR